MSKIKVRYLRERPGPRGGPPRFHWEPSTELRAAGFRHRRLKHPDGRPAETFAEAVVLAEELNQEVDLFYSGRSPCSTGGAAVVTFSMLAREYRLSPSYRKLKSKTRRDYDGCLRLLLEWAGDVPLGEITRGRVRRFYEKLQPANHARANAILRVLRLVLQYGCDHDWLIANAAAKPKLIAVPPRLKIWSDEEFAAVIGAAEALGLPSIADAVWLARYTGQRQDDILRITRLQVAGGRLPMKQSKRGARIDVPFVPALAARIHEALARAQALAPAEPRLLICETTARPWGADHFRHAFADVRAAAAAETPSVAELTFADLRDTCITRMAEAGCTLAEICAVSGHSERSATNIMQHYLAFTAPMAEQAIAKVVAHEGQKTEGRDHD